MPAPLTYGPVSGSSQSHPCAEGTSSLPDTEAAPSGYLVAKMIDHHNLMAEEISGDIGAHVQECGGSPSKLQLELLRFHQGAAHMLSEIAKAVRP